MKRLLRVLAQAGLAWGALTAPGLAAPAPVPQTRQSSVDFDGDGTVDAASLSASGDLTLRLARTSVRLELYQSILGFAVADLDNDGDRDIVGLSAKGSLHIWYNSGAGRFRHERISVNVHHGGLRPSRVSLTSEGAGDVAAETTPRRVVAAVCVAAQPLAAGAGRRALDWWRDLSLPAPCRSLSSPRAPPLSTPA